MEGLQQRTALALSRSVTKGAVGRVVARGWAFAASGYLLAIVLFVVAQFPVNAIFNLGGSTASESLLILFGSHMLIACPTLLGCVNLAVRGYDHASDPDRPIFAWTICGAALLAPILAVFAVLGLIGVVAGGGTGGEVLYGVVLQIAGLVVAVVTAAWSLTWVGAHDLGMT
jgi:hypothetical protein